MKLEADGVVHAIVKMRILISIYIYTIVMTICLSFL